MKQFRKVSLLLFLAASSPAHAQVAEVEPQILTRSDLEGKVTTIHVAPGFVTTIRVPEAVNAVVVGDPAQFQAEHSEREPRLVFVKAVTTKPVSTNLLISTVNGHQISLLLVTHGMDPALGRESVAFLVKYEAAAGFLLAPTIFPFALVGETVPLSVSTAPPHDSRESSDAASKLAKAEDLDGLLDRQRQAPLPTLYGEKVHIEANHGDRVRAGVSAVVDEGQRVVVLFSVVNPTNQNILLMPPQVQLGGQMISGKLRHHKQWSRADQLRVVDFRLSSLRLGPGQRADGVVLFERPPYKQSNEALFLQIAESGAVDRPALAPIAFAVEVSEDRNGKAR